MDQTNNQIPFDPDFDSGSHSVSGEQGVNPLMTFYAGIACSVVVFGLAGIIFLLILIN